MSSSEATATVTVRPPTLYRTALDRVRGWCAGRRCWDTIDVGGSALCTVASGETADEDLPNAVGVECRQDPVGIKRGSSSAGTTRHTRRGGR